MYDASMTDKHNLWKLATNLGSSDMFLECIYQQLASHVCNVLYLKGIMNLK